MLAALWGAASDFTHAFRESQGGVGHLRCRVTELQAGGELSFLLRACSIAGAPVPGSWATWQPCGEHVRLYDLSMHNHVRCERGYVVGTQLQTLSRACSANMSCHDCRQVLLVRRGHAYAWGSTWSCWIVWSC